MAPMEEELRDGYRLREEMEEASRRSGARGAGEGTGREKPRDGRSHGTGEATGREKPRDGRSHGAGEGTEQEKARSRRRGGGRERARREDKGEEWSWEKREAGTPAPAAHQTSQEAAAGALRMKWERRMRRPQRYRERQRPTRLTPGQPQLGQGWATSTMPSVTCTLNVGWSEPAGPCTTFPSERRNVLPCHGHTTHVSPPASTTSPSPSGPVS
jgi:hypothetical protein